MFTIKKTEIETIRDQLLTIKCAVMLKFILFSNGKGLMKWVLLDIHYGSITLYYLSEIINNSKIFIESLS